jgi:hypothetical protein
MTSEIGAEYTLAELQQVPPRTVVILIADHVPHVAVSAWFNGIGSGRLIFHCGEINLTLILFHNAEGDIVDGQDRRIHVHRYLGEV